ncbi:two-component system regulatory protein YycI [Ureibacillus sp. GCM10028918]|uniref:two-component system regulatory protein YycI n=1 Tax=Ureibacillus sp. GCM10028918 TaxID=3273429 RepID=UPI0036076052
MDWSKSKSIFIVVFLILDVFLYSLFLNRHTESQLVQNESWGERNIEDRLKDDNITYGMLPTNIVKAAYISGKAKNFEDEELSLENAEDIKIDKNKLVVTLEEPFEIKNLDEETSYNEFLKLNVYNGTSYTLWQIDKENRNATFFQTMNSRILYYIKNGSVTVHWNDQNEIIRYEQTLLEDLEANEEEKTLTTPLNAITLLYNKGLLESNSKITQVNLGYSTLLQLQQVLVPTWEIRVETENEEVKEYFVNAVEGVILNLVDDASTADEEGDTTLDNNEIDLETELEKSRE